MFKHIFLYELKYWFKKPEFYLYMLVFSGIAFITVAGTAGLFDPISKGQGIAQLVNSPFEVNYLMLNFHKLSLFLLPAIIGATIYKDYKHNTHSILYSFPIKKRDYLMGKFLSALVLVFSISLSISIAMIIAEHLPALNPDKVGSFNILGYVQALLLYVLPNLLFYGAIVFSIVTSFRNIYAGFVAVLILFFLQNIAQNVFDGFFIALFDPFGQSGVMYETQHWTLEDKNTKLIPAFDIVLYNRLLWLAIASVIFGFVYRKFTFSEQPIISLFKEKKEKRPTKNNFKGILHANLPKVNYIFSLWQQLKNCWLLSNIHLRSIVKSGMFYVISGFGIFTVLFAIAKVTNSDEIAILPVTNVVLTIPAFFFTTIIMLLTFIYSGMLIHKDSVSKMDQLVGASPVSNLTLLGSNIIAIMKMQALLLLIMMLAGIIIQVYNNYYHFEIELYLFDLFVIKFLGLIIWAFASIFIHTMIRNTYLGIFSLVIGWLGISGLKQIGVSTRLLLFNFSEPMQYSDLSAYGDQLLPYFVVKGYWFFFATLILIFAYLFWVRGISQTIKERSFMAKLGFKELSNKLIIGLCFTGFIALGFVISTEENKSTELSSKKRNAAFNQFEKDYAKYSSIVNQPKITAINLDIEIFPDSKSLNISGSYTLINKSTEVIDSILIKTGFDEITTFKLTKNSDILDEDKYVKFTVLKLHQGLQPNESLKLDFTIKNKPNTLFENNSNILNNGTFFKNDILPRIGYFLNSNNKHPEDSIAKNKHYYAQDSDFISLKTLISTSKNQTAIAPGYLKKKWTNNNRNYFEYETDLKIKNSLSFSSGDFKIEKEKYKGVDLEIYHHKNHTQNLFKMKEGLKASLDYNTKHFGPYQFTEARIIEFPITEGTYASVMANSIPTSEMRFIANSSNEETIDISFYTIVHELTHQWWANQLVPADAYGAIMLSESVTEYISLNIYKSYYGDKKALDFLKMMRGRYLNGRTGETDSEPPLYLVKGGQQYLAYGKGALAFNTLSHYLGSEKLHFVLRAFFDEYKNKEAPYPTSIQLIERLKEASPASLQYLITDLFETVTFYKNAIQSTEVIEQESNTYKVKVDFSISKFRDGDKTQLLSLNDYIEIGFYDSNDELISIERVKANKESNSEIFQLNKKPAKVILDPNYLTIERDIDDNSVAL